MLLTEFDSTKKAIFNASDLAKKDPNFPKTFVAFFHHELMEQFVADFAPEVIGQIKSCTKDFEVFRVIIHGTPLGVVQLPMGAPYAVAIFEDLVARGMETILLCGSCGCLYSSIEEFSIIVPTASIRDEGTSYHYAPESDTISINEICVSIVESALKKLNIHYTKGINWTMDALYRETPAKVKRRKEQGAITVDMECSAVAAAAKFRKVNFAQIFYGADDLSKEKYDIRHLIDTDQSKHSPIITLALEIGVNLDIGFNGSKLIEQYIR